LYEAKDNHFRSEGDTPAFLHVINSGLRSDEHPSFGGWGGRFAFRNGVWKSVDTKETAPERHSILRWAEDFQNDWAARADWCVKTYADANHPPQVVLSHAEQLTAQPGSLLELDARDSIDPDGDDLSIRWQWYREASDCKASVEVEDDPLPTVNVRIPIDAQDGDFIHFICKVTDNGTPRLTRYGRVIIKVSDQAVGGRSDSE
jgi:hypothetical protein